eukprot:scaffold50387_cov19-Tisochrysis_lutea.AAC.1
MERASLPPTFPAHPTAPTAHDMADAAQQQRPTASAMPAQIPASYGLSRAHTAIRIAHHY